MAVADARPKRGGLDAVQLVVLGGEHFGEALGQRVDTARIRQQPVVLGDVPVAVVTLFSVHSLRTRIHQAPDAEDTGRLEEVSHPL